MFSAFNFNYFQDFNDNAPEFVFPSSNHTIRVLENATVGTEVITIKAVDTDIGSNGRVKYSIWMNMSKVVVMYRYCPNTKK